MIALIPLTVWQGKITVYEAFSASQSEEAGRMIRKAMAPDYIDQMTSPKMTIFDLVYNVKEGPSGNEY